MAGSKFIVSGLEKVVNELPDDFAMKSQSVGNFLSKKGVKPEEMEFSRITSNLPGDKVTKSDLQTAVANRPDEFGKRVTDSFSDVVLPSAQRNPTYRANVYTFKQATPEAQQARAVIHDPNTSTADMAGAIGKVEQTESNYVSSHFEDVPNYLFHTRTYTDNFDQVDTHVITELQSDLHQEAIGGSSAPNAPLSKNMERKAIEREIAYAVENGLEQVAIPIKSSGPEGADPAVVESVIAKMKQSFPDAPEDPSDFADWVDFKQFDENLDIAALTDSNLSFAGVQIQDFDYSDLQDLWYGDSVNATRMLDSMENLARSEGVQRNYETTVANTAKKIAKNNGFTYETVNKDGVEYAMIKLDGKQPKFSLYASPVAGGFAVYQAMQIGASEEQINEALTRNGYEEADFAEMYDMAAKIGEAKAAGIPDEQIRAYLDPELVDTTKAPTQPPKNYFTESEQEFERRMEGAADLPYVDMRKKFAKKQSFDKLTTQELEAVDIVNNLEVIYPTMASTATRISGFFGNMDDARTAEQAATASKQQIINAAARAGVNLQYDPRNEKYVLVTEQGEQDVTPDLWDSIWREKGETAGSIAGGIAGFRAGSRMPGPPVVKAGGAVLASVLGAAAGAAMGTTGDYLWAAMQTSEDLNAQVAAHKALTAAEVSALGDLVIGSGFVGGKAFWKGAVEAKRYLLDGNPQGARKALKESLFVTDEEADDMLNAMSRVATVPGGSPQEKTIAAAALSKPGLEGLVRSTASIDAKTSMAISKGISDRANDVNKVAQSMSDPNLAHTVIADLKNYEYDVKDFYRRVKEVPAQSPNSHWFSFDYDKLMLEPALERIGKNIADPIVLEKFLRKANMVRSYSESRQLSDLIELRELVNDFKFNTRIRNTKDFDMLNKSLSMIDAQIEQGAKQTITNSKNWLTSYGQAKAKYAEMKRTQNNVLYKALNRDGINTDTMVKRLGTYITAADGTFDEVLAKLPKQTRGKVEGSVINMLTEKYTTGIQGNTAINFPMLSSKLDQIGFTTPEARKYKRAIADLANVFKNDIAISQASGRLQIQPFQSFLTADPATRAQFAVASSMFNHIRKFKPTQEGRQVALVLKTAEVLENPLKSKPMKELMQEVSGDMEVTNAMQEYMRQYVDKAGSKPARVQLYGDGKLLSVKGSGEPTKRIAVDKIATSDIAYRVAEADGFNVSNTKALDHALKSRGYMAVQVGTEKVREIK